MLLEIREKRLQSVFSISHVARQFFLFFGSARKLVGSYLMVYLDPMFGFTEKTICVSQINHRLLIKQSGFVQQSKSFQSALRPNTRGAATIDQLKGLDEKFDFAYAALSQLDVNSGLAPDLSFNPGLHQTHVFECGIIQIPTIDKWFEFLQEIPPQAQSRRPGGSPSSEQLFPKFFPNPSNSLEHWLWKAPALPFHPPA